MNAEFSELQVLVDLGLTLIQARTYMALVKTGPLETLAIAKISKVARPDLYLTLSKLEKLGLVKKIIKKPFIYEATPLSEGLSLLLETKTKQYKKVRADTQLLLDTANTQKLNNTKQTDEPQFALIPKGRIVVDRIRTAVGKAQQSIELVLSWKRFSRGIVSSFAESMEIAWKKNVKIRFIIESPLENKTAQQLIQFCKEKPSCQLRFIPNSPKTVFGIYDKREIFVIVFSETDLPGSPALWSNNSSLIALAADHFEMLWLKAGKQPSRLHTNLGSE